MIVSDFIENVCVIFQHMHKWRGREKLAPGRKFPDVSLSACTWWNRISGQSLQMTPWPLCFLSPDFRAKFQSFATQRVFGLCKRRALEEAGSMSKARPPTQDPCHCFISAIAEFLVSSFLRAVSAICLCILSADRHREMPCRWSGFFQGASSLVGA